MKKLKKHSIRIFNLLSGRRGTFANNKRDPVLSFSDSVCDSGLKAYLVPTYVHQAEKIIRGK